MVHRLAACRAGKLQQARLGSYVIQPSPKSVSTGVCSTSNLPIHGGFSACSSTRKLGQHRMRFGTLRWSGSYDASSSSFAHPTLVWRLFLPPPSSKSMIVTIRLPAVLSLRRPWCCATVSSACCLTGLSTAVIACRARRSSTYASTRPQMRGPSFPSTCIAQPRSGADASCVA